MLILVRISDYMSEPITKTREEILNTPIKDLGLNLQNSELSPAVEKLYKELEVVGLKFRPQVYLTDDWGCPDDVPIIGAPFYLADKALRKIEEEKMGSAESAQEIEQILRHEAGHAFNYAYFLHKAPNWDKIFGVYEKPYEDNFAPIVGSGKFVHHLGGWYAQKHPDEDFAETFAILITPNLDWKKLYKGTRAYKKLAYALELIKKFSDAPLQNTDNELDAPVESILETVDEWYKKRFETQKPKKKIMILFDQTYPKKEPFRDEVVDQVKEALLKTGYPVVLFPISRSIERISIGVKQEKPDLIFNLCETFRNNDKFDFNVIALLEMTGAPFTGSGSGGLFLSQDKYLSKKIFNFHKINCPEAFVVKKGGEISIPKNFSFPLFVKPVHEDASIGVDENSFVENPESLEKKVKEVHEKIGDDALVEEFIDGREFFVSILGNENLKPLPIVELDYIDWPEGKPKIYTQKAKISERSKEYKSTKPKIPDDLDIETQSKIYDTAIAAYRALEIKDYGRIDMRMTKDGKIFVLEANPNPYLAVTAETIFAAQAANLDYQQLLDKIIEAALTRVKAK